MYSYFHLVIFFFPPDRSIVTAARQSSSLSYTVTLHMEHIIYTVYSILFYTRWVIILVTGNTGIIDCRKSRRKLGGSRGSDVLAQPNLYSFMLPVLFLTVCRNNDPNVLFLTDMVVFQWRLSNHVYEPYRIDGRELNDDNTIALSRTVYTVNGTLWNR